MLTDRDRAVLKSVRQWRYLRTSHIYLLHFDSHHASSASGIRACNRVLNRLLEHGLLHRLDRPVGGDGGGSSSFAWCIGPAGDRVLRADPAESALKRFRGIEPTTAFLAHTLAIADVRVRMEVLQRAGLLEIVDVQAEPAAWRSFAWAGRPITLKPDMYAVTAIGSTEWVRYYEIDLSTESLRVLVEKKARAYELYARTGTDEARLGVIPEVLWVTRDEARAEAFREALHAARNITLRLHRIITAAELDAALTNNEEVTPENGPEEGGNS